MKVGRIKGLFYISVYLGISPPLEPFDPDMPLLWAWVPKTLISMVCWRPIPEWWYTIAL